MSIKLFELLLQASIYTVTISVVSILIGFAIAILLSGMLLSGRSLFVRSAQIFISFFRGVPLLVQLLLIYNLLPAIGINVPSIVAAIIGLSLCTAAYQAENLRGGFASVPLGLLESAEMVGLTPRQVFRRIKVPIALRLTFPALVNEAILILKASSLVSVVGIVELTRMAQDLAGSTFLPLQIFASAGLIYLMINWLVALAGGMIENRLPGVPR
ncbi:amino acid ABC transporter permease protein (plasmid) [Rhizobium phaseoli]|uniref:Probable amino acid ABC transporter, permease protein n=1 Tax=Rhizobium etli (strain CIAT 652) TaxID=491916 RepID=B3Q3Z7_RHIE6|nr:amino acid ABC transporter permease [Rhizobium phaseoli]ACE94801.1 probable amino acid ABC transporter, permease protein [Rhizobium etli CIAT 652]EGE61259.1 putative amino acid ABC transporter permease [Rhizobium etli CNPAF512]ANL31749.1 amino acid ABC transporter permease protein [Rhizobium phaseoli]ARM16324.1 amino acid ABC transporter permease protein [Rhizobium phaseoli Brasil 5]MDK4725547.1 amino acid ABC transporter permease [Rhizobium phaseoli]